MEALLIINIILNLIYLTISVIKLKYIPESISETSYMWEENCKDEGTLHKAHIFSLYCFLTSALLFYPWIVETAEKWQFLCFIACAGLIASGTTPFFKERYQFTIHYIGALVAFFSWLVWMCVSSQWIGLGISVGIFIILTIWKKESFVFWAEILSIFTLFVLLLIEN